LLNHSVSSYKDLYNTSSPQYQALYWLAVQDQANLNISTNTPLATILDRYIVAALYYHSPGAYFAYPSSFLSAASICHWNVVSDNTQMNRGVFCNPHLQIIFCKSSSQSVISFLAFFLAACQTNILYNSLDSLFDLFLHFFRGMM
jgi:hypothetical protein